MKRKKSIILWTVLVDIGLCCMFGLLVLLYHYDISKIIDACVGFCLMVFHNHIIAKVILNSINYMEITQRQVVFRSIKGELYSCLKTDVQRVSKLTFGRGYKIKTKEKAFRVDLNQDNITIIVDGVTRTELLPGDFPLAVYDM